MTLNLNDMVKQASQLDEAALTILLTALLEQASQLDEITFVIMFSMLNEQLKTKVLAGETKFLIKAPAGTKQESIKQAQERLLRDNRNNQWTFGEPQEIDRLMSQPNKGWTILVERVEQLDDTCRPQPTND